MGIGGERAMAESRSFAPVTPLRGAPIHPSDEDLSLGTPASCSAQDDKSWLNGYWWRTRHGGKQVLRFAYPAFAYERVGPQFTPATRTCRRDPDKLLRSG